MNEVQQEFVKVQKQIDSKKLGGNKAKKVIYSLLKDLNQFCRVGNRRFTSQFLTDMVNRKEIVEVFNGEHGGKIFTFVFSER